jgi:hypothetical protein
MKTLKMIVAVVVASTAAGAAYAGDGSYTLAQAERVQAAPRYGEMPAPRPGWNKGSQYGVEWLTRTTHNRSEVSSTSQPPASTEQSAGKNCNLKPMAGFKQLNGFEHSC